MTPAKRTKQGGLTVVQMVRLTNKPRQTLYDLFNRDPLKFDELLIEAMKQQCIDDIFALKLSLANNINNINNINEIKGERE